MRGRFSIWERKKKRQKSLPVLVEKGGKKKEG